MGVVFDDFLRSFQSFLMLMVTAAALLICVYYARLVRHVPSNVRAKAWHVVFLSFALALIGIADVTVSWKNFRAPYEFSTWVRTTGFLIANFGLIILWGSLKRERILASAAAESAIKEAENQTPKKD